MRALGSVSRRCLAHTRARDRCKAFFRTVPCTPRYALGARWGRCCRRQFPRSRGTRRCNGRLWTFHHHSPAKVGRRNTSNRARNRLRSGIKRRPALDQRRLGRLQPLERLGQISRRRAGRALRSRCCLRAVRHVELACGRAMLELLQRLGVRFDVGRRPLLFASVRTRRLRAIVAPRRAGASTPRCGGRVRTELRPLKHQFSSRERASLPTCPRRSSWSNPAITFAHRAS